MKLSDQLKAARADRPDEWTMDRFIREAEELEKAAQSALDGLGIYYEPHDGWIQKLDSVINKT